jgi:phosphatidylethanolamine/phosphatidyl-N-methylethanolamine N-methyltransferase
MMDWIDWSAVESVVEYGAGTGALTHAIWQRALPGTKLLAVEIDPVLAEMTARRVPAARVCNTSATNIEAICRAEGFATVDIVISGLPWAVFDQKQQVDIVIPTKRILRPGGYFVTFAHPPGFLVPGGWRFRRLIEREFASVHRTPLVWRNFPPAFVYRCQVAARPNGDGVPQSGAA